MRATLANEGHDDNDCCFVFEMQDGRIRRVREDMDTRRGAEWFATPRPAEAAASART